MLVDFFKLTNDNKITHATHVHAKLYDSQEDSDAGWEDATYVVNVPGFELSDEALNLMEVDDPEAYMERYHFLNIEGGLSEANLLTTITASVRMWHDMNFTDRLIVYIDDVYRDVYSSTYPPIPDDSIFLSKKEYKGFYLDRVSCSKDTVLILELKRAEPLNLVKRTLTL